MASTGEVGRFVRRPVFIALAAALALLTSAAVFRSPSVEDPYLWFDDVHVQEWAGVDIIDGLPKVTYPGVPGPPREDSVTIAQWGLSNYSRGDTATAIRAADWLVEHQREDGAWDYDFDFYVDSAGASVYAGWISGMGQGQALSLFERVWRLTGDDTYLQAGRAAMGVLSVPVAEGGVYRTWRGHPFYEEYPTKPMSFVLNGFLFTLIGLHDFAEATGDPEAARLWREGEATAAATFPLFSIGEHDSAYALAFRAGGPPPILVRGSVYDKIHVDLAEAMHELTGREVYATYAERWAGALPTPWYLSWPTGATALALAAGGGWFLSRRRRLRGVEGDALEAERGERAAIVGDLTVCSDDDGVVVLQLVGRGPVADR